MLSGKITELTKRIKLYDSTAERMGGGDNNIFREINEIKETYDKIGIISPEKKEQLQKDVAGLEKRNAFGERNIGSFLSEIKRIKAEAEAAGSTEMGLSSRIVMLSLENFRRAIASRKRDIARIKKFIARV